MKNEFVVALVGKYPPGTYDLFQKRLSVYNMTVLLIDTEEKFMNLKRANCIILRVFKLNRMDIERIDNLKMICRWGVGYDSVDILAAKEYGIAVCNTPGANAHAVSEHTIMLMLALAHNVIRHTFSLRDGIWSKLAYEQQSITLKGKLIGLIGAGNISCQVAEKARAFGANIQYYDINRLPKDIESKLNMNYVELEKLLRTSDFISIHIPLTENTKYFLNKNQFKMMKMGAYLINTSRGGLINERDLIEFVRSGHLAGVGLDCTENEPIENENELLKYSNVIITPHVAGTCSDIGDVIFPMIVDNIENLYFNKPLKNIVNNV